MKWMRNTEISDEEVSSLANELGVSDILVRIALNRNNDKDFVKTILRDVNKGFIDSSLLVNGQAVADRITEHINKGNIICIHADYDSDGVNSGYIMHDVINNIILETNSNAQVEVYYPERVNGYGLSFAFAEDVIKFREIANKDILVVTVDNGIAQVEQIQMLIDNGIEVVVTDHHKSLEVVPNCLICDPHNEHTSQDETYHHLCGAGVAYKVCDLLQKNFNIDDMGKYLVNVAVATITDVMPLTTENIAFVEYGLSYINSEYCPNSLRAMKDFLGIDIMNSQHLAWEIGPRLNACGRMNNTALAGALMHELDYDKCVDIVNEIEVINDTRKELTNNAKKQISKMNFSKDNFCVIHIPNLEAGIVGILAGNTAEMFGKPAIVVTESANGTLVGSSRSVPGIDLHQLFSLEVEKGNMIKFGGHSEAAGVEIPLHAIDSLQQSLNETIEQLALVSIMQNGISGSEVLAEPTLMIDELITIDWLTKDVFDHINFLPYDKNLFSKPVFALTDCTVVEAKPTAKNKDNIWLTLEQNGRRLKIWCQGLTKAYEEANCPTQLHVAGYIEKNFMEVGRPYTFKAIDVMRASA